MKTSSATVCSSKTGIAISCASAMAYRVSMLFVSFCGYSPLISASNTRYRTLSVSTLPYIRVFRGSVDSHCTPTSKQLWHGSFWSLPLDRLHRIRLFLHRSQLTRARRRRWSGIRAFPVFFALACWSIVKRKSRAARTVIAVTSEGCAGCRERGSG